MKSDIVVPAVLVVRITSQYSGGWKACARICRNRLARKMPSSRMVLAA